MGTNQAPLNASCILKRVLFIAGVVLSPVLNDPDWVYPSNRRENTFSSVARKTAVRTHRNSFSTPTMQKDAAIPVPSLPLSTPYATNIPKTSVLSGDNSFSSPPNPIPSFESAHDLWQKWQYLLLEKKAYQQMPILNARLAVQLRKGGGANIYEDIRNLLINNDLEVTIRAQLIELLGEIATPKALALILESAQQGIQSPLYGPALHTVSRIAENHWGARFHPELSPLLERAWRTSDDLTDESYIRAIGQAMATIGTPGSVVALLDTLLNNPSASLTNDIIRKKIAFSEIPKITNPAAVPVLKQAVLATNANTASSEKISDSPSNEIPYHLSGARSESSRALRVVDSTYSDKAAELPAHQEVATTEISTVEGPILASVGTELSHQPALVSVVLEGLKNIATQEAMDAVLEIHSHYPTIDNIPSQEPDTREISHIDVGDPLYAPLLVSP